MPTFHQWFIYSFVHLFVAAQRILSPLYNSPWMQEWGGMRQDCCGASEQNWVRTQRIRPAMLWVAYLAKQQEKEFIFAFCLCGRREGEEREQSKVINVHVCRSLSLWFQRFLVECSSTMHCPGARAALPLHRAALQPAFAFSPAAWRGL